MSDSKWTTQDTLGILFVLFCAFGLVAGFLFGWPMYSVWKAGKTGEAALKQAEQEKLIMIESAKAEVEASRLRAEAISLVGEMAQKYPEYRKQEFIGAFAQALESGRISQIIYVPTEAGIPIIEAKR